MNFRECACRVPEPHPNPRKEGFCVRCGYWINPEWTSNDQTMAEFFGRLEEAFPGQTIQAFRAHCEAREKAGRTRFRHSFHGRDLPAEGMEEAADGALYAAFEILKGRRAGTEDADDLALTAAFRFAQAHEALAHLSARRKGAP